MISNAINNIFNLYFFILILRIFLTWIPNVDWNNQFFATIGQISDLYLDRFRKVVPPLNGLDFSPIIALIVLQIVQNVLVFCLVKVGL